jgi:hypothetical protein
LLLVAGALTLIPKIELQNNSAIGIGVAVPCCCSSLPAPPLSG